MHNGTLTINGGPRCVNEKLTKPPTGGSDTASAILRNSRTKILTRVRSFTIRICTKCNGVEPEVKFSGHHRKCNRCRNADAAEYMREYKRKRRKSPEGRSYNAEKTREYRSKYPYMALYTTSHYLAKKAGVYSDLTKEQAEELHNIPEICSYCGRTPEEAREKRAFCIDHIIPMIQGGPNSRWNMTKSCNSCNVRKGSSSLLDFYERTPEFTPDRFDTVVRTMSSLSGYSVEFINELLAQSNEFEKAHRRERERLLLLLSNRVKSAAN